MVVGELGAVIESDTAPKSGRKGRKLAQQFTGDRIGSLVGLAVGEQQSGAAFMGDEHRLSVATKEHQIPLPMAHRNAGVDLKGAFVNGHASLNVLYGAAPAHAQPAAAVLELRQQAMPVILLGAAMVDEPVNGFVGDDTVSSLGPELARDFCERPTGAEPTVYVGTQRRIAGEFEACVPMASALAHRLCAGGLVAAAPRLGRLAIAPKLAADRTDRAPQGGCYGSH